MVTLLEVHLAKSFRETGEARFDRVKFYTSMYGAAKKEHVLPAFWAEAQRILGNPMAKKSVAAVPLTR